MSPEGSIPAAAVPDYPPRAPRRRWRPYAVAGGAGAVVAFALGALALATGVVDGHTTRVVRQAPVASARPTTARAFDARAIYARDARGVAFIQSSGIATDTPFGRTRGVATGSGFALDRRGDILTNDHVVDGARRVTVRLGGGNGAVPATVVGTDNSNDLAILHVDPGKVALHPLPLGASAAARVGDPVVAIGNPFGFDRTITSGIVSAKQRRISGPNGFTIDHVIQTDAAINPGNSGGPLIDHLGRVIGINSQIATGGSGDASVGIGFAIPIETARHELSALERGGSVQHAFLGVETSAAPGGRRGALVRRVDPGSPAATAGLRAGDVIVALNGSPIGGPDGLAQEVGARRPGQTVALGYVRHGTRHTASVRLAVRPSLQPASAGAAPARPG